MTVLEFEKWIWQHEKVKVFVRAKKDTEIKIENSDMPMFSSTNNVRQFKQLRLAPILENFEYVIFTASLAEAADEMKLLELRKDYRDHNI